MDKTIVDNFNAVVKEEDTVYHLGDFVWNERRHGEMLKSLLGHHILVPGNHDRCHSSHRQHAFWKVRYTSWGFEVLDNRVETTFPELGTVLLTHFPDTKASDRHAKHMNFRPTYKGIVVCGHVHDIWKTSANCVNVGVDVWGFKPVSIEELAPVVENLRKESAQHETSVVE